MPVPSSPNEERSPLRKIVSGILSGKGKDAAPDFAEAAKVLRKVKAEWDEHIAKYPRK